MNTNNQIVIKPWGREYCCFRNPEVAIWVLEINKGAATSLHCHPRKNTAMVILRGEIELTFIRDTIPRRFVGLDKINIFRGRFHKTRAVSEGVVLLEVEAPDDKRDIVRLEDEYGRSATPLEDATLPLDEDCLQITDSTVARYFSGCGLRIVSPEQINSFNGRHIFVTLHGGLAPGLVPSGDVIDGGTLARFIQTFKPITGTSFLHIWRQ